MRDQSPNPCPGQEENIYLYLDEELPPAERTAFEAHLATCRACQALLAETKSLFAELSTLDSVAAPAEIVTGVMASLPSQNKSRRLTPAGQLILAAQAIIGSVLLFVGLSRFATVYSNRLPSLLWPGLPDWPGLPELRVVIANQLAGAGVGLIARVEGYWSQIHHISVLNISTTTAAAIIVGLGLAWLVGNVLLLNRPGRSLTKHSA